MTQPTDSELLRGVTADRSEAAFGLLVRRHLDVVYASALRQVRDPATAEDVTQAAFVLLWQRAARLRHGDALCGWLLTVVRLAARDANRRRVTRQRHEHQAAQMKSDPPAPDWDHLRRVLDAGLAELSPADRTAVALRYLEGHTSDAVAAITGVTEAAARKRTQRAVDRLRAALARRGLATRADVLTAGLSAVAVVAPPRLADAVGAAAAEPSPAVIRLTRAAGRSLRRAAVTPFAAAAAAAVLVGVAALAWVATPAAKPVAAAAARVPRPTTLPTTLPAAEQARELDRLEAGLASQAAGLSNLRVDATLRWEKWDAAAAAWKPYGDSACTAWYDGKPGGKARIDYHRQVMPWTDGAGPFAWSVSDDAFDGVADRLLTIEVGTPDHRTRILQRVEVRHERRSYAYDGRDAGWSISTSGGGDGRGYLAVVRELRLASARSIVSLSVGHASFAATPCLVLTATDRRHRTTVLFFDPAHGYTCRGTDGDAYDRLTIDELIEVAPGVYYPGRAVGYRPEQIEGRVRWRYEAANAVANGTAFGDDVYRLLPPGVPVFDMDAPGQPRRIAN